LNRTRLGRPKEEEEQENVNNEEKQRYVKMSTKIPNRMNKFNACKISKVKAKRINNQIVSKKCVGWFKTKNRKEKDKSPKRGQGLKDPKRKREREREREATKRVEQQDHRN
jgi:hypothetical protein